MGFSARRNRDNAFDCKIPMSALSRLCFPLELIANLLQILPYFFYNFFILNRWHLIFLPYYYWINSLSIYIKNFEISLGSSIVFLVSESVKLRTLDFNVNYQYTVTLFAKRNFQGKVSLVTHLATLACRRAVECKGKYSYTTVSYFSLSVHSYCTEYLHTTHTVKESDNISKVSIQNK